jgi:DNA-binding MarR family transcriptional regulator
MYDLLNMIGYTEFGVLSALKSVFSSGNGMLNIRQFSDSSGISRSAFKVQLRSLERHGLIRLGRQEKLGRQIEILWRENKIRYSEDGTHQFPADDLSLIQPLDLAALSPDEDMEQGKLFHSPSQPWEKAQLVEQAVELFYVGMAAKAEINSFSMQTVNLYIYVSKEQGKDYAAALFLILLPKVKDNPTGYISSAYKHGAAPTSDSILKVHNMWEQLYSLEKAPKYTDAKKEIINALELNDLESATSLTQAQKQIKATLQMFSWSGTADELREKRDSFLASLFG